MTGADAIMIWIFLYVGGGVGALVFSIFAIKRALKKRFPDGHDEDTENSDTYKK